MRFFGRRSKTAGGVLHRPQPGVLRGAPRPAPHGQPPRPAATPGEAPLPRGALLRPPGPRPLRALGRLRRRPPPPGLLRPGPRARGRHGHPRRARRRALRRPRGRRARLQLDARRAPPRLARPLLPGQRRRLPRRRNAPRRRAREEAARQRRRRRRDGRLLRGLRGPPPPLPRPARPPAQALHRRRARVPWLLREDLRELQGPPQRARRRRLGQRHGRAGRLLLRAAGLRAGRRRQAPVARRRQRAHGGHAVPQDGPLLHRAAGFPGQERGLVLVRRRHGRGQARAPRHCHGRRALRLRHQPVRRPRLPRPQDDRRRGALEFPEQAHEPEGARGGELLPEARHARRAALLLHERQHLGVQWPRARADVHAQEELRWPHLRFLHWRRPALCSAQRGECVRRLGDAAPAHHLIDTACSALGFAVTSVVPFAFFVLARHKCSLVTYGRKEIRTVNSEWFQQLILLITVDCNFRY
ncbi:hypothetical protein BRADI_2g57080v3 [Brachypodium distachyon]|uniref:Uncharacterized protein n=1 Tax=Brachypodium distachyon TaxID=15368 RepID=A0A2K2DGB7_BRADI|nr:hypothetical protein BRADI_2g57080v3 [Brachypodium distachyon]